MRIEHVAIWTKNLEEMKEFYTRYFDATSNEKYSEEEQGFESYFITFDSGARLELMKIPSIVSDSNADKTISGFTHLAFSVGSNLKVDSMTKRFEQDGYKIMSFPRETGDGYYESAIYDPDGNIIEITI